MNLQSALLVCSTTALLFTAVSPFSLSPTFSMGQHRLSLNNHPIISIRNSVLLSSKWDNLVDEDDEEEDDDDDDDDDYEANIPLDMRYIPRNVVRQNQNFVAIREAGGPELTNDLYAREPTSSTFWFCGKVARVSDVSVEQTVARQWPLIVHHAANLRRLELYPHRRRLEIWTAPGDTEMDVVYNRPHVVFQKINPNMIDEDVTQINKMLMGFQGEMYDKDEEGFRTLRTEDGRPLNPEIVVTPDGGSTPTASEEDMEMLMKAMKNLDVNELYKAQEAREGREVIDIEDEDDHDE